MKSDNELIAEFMDISVSRFGELLYYCEKDSIIDFVDGPGPYWPNRDWNQLMPVVEKCYEVCPRYDKECQWSLGLLDSAYNDFSVIDRIGPIHKSVVEFIKVYNSHQAQNKTV